MKGQELYEHLFGSLKPYELEEHDEVSGYEEGSSYRDGWYIITEITFRYRGKRYSIERKDHASDNVCDTKWLIDRFHQVVTVNDLAKAIDNIISGIENETYSSFEEIVFDLENLRKNAEFYTIE